MTFATLDPSTPAIIGAFGVMLGGFFAIAKVMLTQASNDRESDRKERFHLTQAIEHMAKSSTEVAKATQKSAREAKERNGHLGEQNLQLAELVTAQNKDVEEVKLNTAKTAEILSKSALIAAEDRDALVNVNQTVKEQTVEHQIIKEQV